MDFGRSFPISEFYRENIEDAQTLSRSGTWWSAVIVIRDPRSRKRFVGLYKWQKSGDTWKTRSKFNIRSSEEAQKLIESLIEYKDTLENR